MTLVSVLSGILVKSKLLSPYQAQRISIFIDPGNRHV